MNQKEEKHQLSRYSFTLPESLIISIDTLANDLHINRSMVVREALAQWMNDQLKIKKMVGHGVAIINYTFDHHEKRIIYDIMDVQHNYESVILHSSHIHLNHNDCFESVICRGNLSLIKELADSMRFIKGLGSFHIEFTHSSIEQSHHHKE